VSHTLNLDPLPPNFLGRRNLIPIPIQMNSIMIPGPISLNKVLIPRNPILVNQMLLIPRMKSTQDLPRKRGHATRWASPFPHFKERYNSIGKVMRVVYRARGKRQGTVSVFHCIDAVSNGIMVCHVVRRREQKKKGIPGRSRAKKKKKVHLAKLLDSSCKELLRGPLNILSAVEGSIELPPPPLRPLLLPLLLPVPPPSSPFYPNDRAQIQCPCNWYRETSCQRNDVLRKLHPTQSKYIGVGEFWRMSLRSTSSFESGVESTYSCKLQKTQIHGQGTQLPETARYSERTHLLEKKKSGFLLHRHHRPFLLHDLD
jgi:hypothetical protein